MGLPARMSRAPVQKMGRVRDGDDPGYIDLLHQMPSIISGQRPVIVHHLLHVDGPKGVARKNEDRWGLPITDAEHRDVHAKGDDEGRLMELGVDGRYLAKTFWEARSGGIDALYRIVWNSLQKRGIHIPYEPPEIINKRTRYL